MLQGGLEISQARVGGDWWQDAICVADEAWPNVRGLGQVDALDAACNVGLFP
jgi:hypothetical protein